MANRPEAEIKITTEVVRSLLTDQFGDLAELPLRELSRGWDNTNYRLGDDMLVRVPHRKVAAPLIEHERAWLPRISELVELGVPAPLHNGQPNEDFPWPWSITRYFPGDEAASATLADPAQTARTLGTFLRQLHVAGPLNGPVNPYRGVPLADRRDSFEQNMLTIDGRVDTTSLRSAFEAGTTAPPATARVWLHGDLHVRNMIVHAGELTAAIDWGDISTGDRATDLAAAFMLVPNHYETVQSAAQASDADMVRAKGWAANFCAIYLAFADDDPVMDAIGNRLLDTLSG